MTWTKIDDHFHAHPKVVRAWNASRAAVGLHVLAMSHSAAYLTDGHVDEAWVKMQLPSPAERRRVLAALVDAGLWERNGAGWMIHDFLDFNESRAQVIARRSADSQRKVSERNPVGTRSPRAGAHARVPARPTPDLFPSAS